jgi:hypothetical protein
MGVTLVFFVDLVSHTREHGALGLNQLLKQLRDYAAEGGEFPPYTQGLAQGQGFRHLGPLQLPRSLRNTEEK